MKKPSKKIEQETLILEPISQTQYINNILINNVDSYEKNFRRSNNNNSLLEKYFSFYKPKNFNKYFFRLNYINNIKSFYKADIISSKIKHKNQITAIIYFILYLFEVDNSKIYNKRDSLLKKYIHILNKLHFNNLIDDSDIILIIKFIIFSSIYERKEIDNVKVDFLSNLTNKRIKNYKIFKYSIEIVKEINKKEITEIFFEFLINKILQNKTNLFLISKKSDMLNLLYLDETKENKIPIILDSLSKIYSFKYNKFFLDIFFGKINDKYKDNINTNNPIDLLNDINKSLTLLLYMQNKEDDIYKNDSYFLSHGFVCNNDRFNGITVENVIIQTEFTIIFSFNYSPELDFIDSSNPKTFIKSNSLKPKQVNIFQKDLSYPILYLISNNRNDVLSFFIQDGYLYHKVFNINKEIKICPVKRNQTYICCYTIKENHEYILYIKSEIEDKLIRDNYNFMLKRNLTLKIGKNSSRVNFEGYIGPVLMFKKYYELEFLKSVLCFRGSYEKILYMHNFSTDFINKYDKIQNNLKIFNSDKKSRYFDAIKTIVDNNINDSLENIVTPVYEGSRLAKKIYIDCTFKETKVSYLINPKIENGATFFFRNNYTPFEFIKYEGINYLILIFELISRNVDNIKNDSHKDIILDIFVNIINYSNNIVNLICYDYYKKEIKRLLFAIEKCIIKICKKIKMDQKMNNVLGFWLLNLSSKLPNLTNEKLQNNIIIRNEILKLLLDTNLFNLNNYSSLSYFLKVFNDNFSSNCTGLLNMEMFKKVVNFAIVFEQITNPKITDVKNNTEYKIFKKQFKECLDSFFELFEDTEPFIYIFEIFSSNIKLNYYKYQFLKIFYLNSEYFFQNVNKNLYLSTWKYFVELYEYYLSKKKFTEITKREAQIIMALCLRIIFENPIVEDFYTTNKKLIDALQLAATKARTINQNSINIWDINDLEDEKIKRKINGLNTVQRKRANSFSYEINNQINLKKSLNNNVFIRKNSNDKAMNYKVNKYGFKVDNKKKDILYGRRSRDKSISFEIINKPFFTSKKYYDYCYFLTLFPKLCSSTNFNDYCFRSLLLLILEKNNEENISQQVKFKFITKVKTYEDLSDKDFTNFLKLKYYNKETKKQFINLINIIEKNVTQISSITYDTMLYLILKISKEKDNNKCVFRHLINSRKICGKLFLLAFTHNSNALATIFGKFSKIISLIIPHHKNPFIFDFLYDIMINENLRNYGQVLINTMVVLSFENNIDLKYVFYFKVNTLILLYRIIKSKNIKNENYNFEEQVISNLFDDNLITTKYNMLYNISWAKGKKKCYVEMLYEVLVGLSVKSQNDKYFLMLYKMFVMYVTKFTNEGGHTILPFIDQISSPCNKSNPVQQYFSKYDTIEVPSLTLQILLRTLKYYTKYKNTKAKDTLVSLSSAFSLDATDLFLGKDSKKKKENKNKIMYNELRNIISTSCKKPKGKDKDKDKNKKFKYIDNEVLLTKFEQIYNKHLSNKYDTNNSVIMPKLNLVIPKIMNFKFLNDNPLTDDSFSSCKSDKNTKNECINNQKKKFKTINKENSNKYLNLIEKINENDLLFNFDDNDNKKNKNNIININKLDDINPFDFKKTTNFNEILLFPKQNLIEQIFAIYFVKKLFYNESFVKMRNYYKYIIKKETGQIINMKNYFKFPIIMKNYIPENLYFGGLFLKNDLNFFSNKYFKITHPYFKEKVQNIKINRIFKKKSETNDINQFILDKNDQDNNMFYVDLITNRNVVFGELIVGKHLIYFHSKDKKKFLFGKSEKEIEKWILCSSDGDYSSKKKKIYIFKDEITEIINRRFLYSFQACEFYLKNGKSYYFNFYSEEKKIKFFSLFSKKNFIISDLKSEFKKKNYTKLWLSDSISTLAYLLFINKYSCRSYNDVNQYPVFPWLKIAGDKERDLRYTVAAQTEEARMILKEMYSVNNFPHHYTTHYSNASFLIYYLLRINPFTDNQITLQVNKFDAPERQFTSIDEIQYILMKTRQPREIIPEFFINTDFFYNYNCNYFGIKNNGELVDNLDYNKNYKNPLDYILTNATMLESNKVKSTINNFFDDVFGIGQMGGCEKYNTYDKYCYQEMIDLTHKIENFQNNGLSLKEIKEKIARKSNKIISFGQTPFKLFEDKHPQWTKEKTVEKNNKSDKKDKNENNNNSRIKFNYKIIYFGFLKNNINNISSAYFYVLQKININNFELRFYDLALKEEKDKNFPSPILIQKKIKLFSKLKIFENSFLYSYKYNPNQIMINYELLLFIFVHLTDNSFTIFNIKGQSKSYLTGSLITCIIKSKGYNFLTGHINGKINEWTINFKREEGTNYINLNDVTIGKKREYIAHKNSVNLIHYSILLDLIISSGDDKIYIRKYYDLSLLSVINIENTICIELKISLCYLYILFYDEIRKSYIIKVYSVNGILVAQSDYGLINNIDCDKEGNILVGYFQDYKIDIYNPSIQKKIYELRIDNSQKDTKDEISNSKQILIFQSFYYNAINNSVYCSFSNGCLIKKFIEFYNKDK